MKLVRQGSNAKEKEKKKEREGREVPYILEGLEEKNLGLHL